MFLMPYINKLLMHFIHISATLDASWYISSKKDAIKTISHILSCGRFLLVRFYFNKDRRRDFCPHYFILLLSCVATRYYFLSNERTLGKVINYGQMQLEHGHMTKERESLIQPYQEAIE